MQPHIEAAGMPWFDEDDYAAFRSILPDRKWHRTFQEWEAAAQKNKDRLHYQGIRAIKVQVRSAAFVEWCRSTGRRIDNDALLALANEAAFRDITGEH